MANEEEKVEVLGSYQVTPNGRALEFSLVWDGVDLIGEMSIKER